MYPNYNAFRPNLRAHNNNNYYDDRFFGAFAVPFLLGGLGGAAIVGLSRPRPVYYNSTQPYPYPYPYPYQYPYYGY